MRDDGFDKPRCKKNQGKKTQCQKNRHNLTSLQDLFTSTGSLTRHLERLAGQKMIIKVRYQKYRLLSFGEKKALGLPLARACIGWVRAVELYGDDKNVWVYATSVLAMDSLIGEGKRLKQLGDTPMGYVLFKKGALPFVRTYRTKDRTRQTVYDWQGRKVLISEHFAPFLIKSAKKA